MATAVPSYAVRTVDVVWSLQLAISSASANQVSVDHTVRMCRDASTSLAKMVEPVSKTPPVHSSTAAAVPHTSPDDTVRSGAVVPYHPFQPVPTCSVKAIQGIKYVTISVTTMSASGMEETAHFTGHSLGLTALPVFRAGSSLRTGIVIRSVTTLDVSSTALSVRRPHRGTANMTSIVQTTMVTASVTRAATQRPVVGMAWTVLVTPQPRWRTALW